MAAERARRTTTRRGVHRPLFFVAESKRAELSAETEWRRDSFKSVYRDGYFAHLIDVPDQQSGVELGRHLLKDRRRNISASSRSCATTACTTEPRRRSIIRRWRGTPNGVGPANAIPRDFSV